MNKIIEEDIQYILNSDVDFQRFENSTVLITGANGMLASYIVMTLLYLNKFYNYNIKVIAIARNKSNFYKMFNDFIEDRNLIFIELDIININEDIFKDFEIDYIIHAASPSRTQQFFQNPLDVIYPNVFSTDKLFSIAVKKNIKSFLYFSSCAIYGKVDSVYYAEDNYGSISPLDLINVYAESKRMGELVIKSDGKAKRAFCYIVDATIGFLKILLEGKNGEAYNVSNNQGIISIIDLAKLLYSMYPEKSLNVIIENENKSYRQLIDSLSNYYVDTKKLEKLNWKPNYTIKEGFKRCVDYFNSKK